MNRLSQWVFFPWEGSVGEPEPLDGSDWSTWLEMFCGENSIGLTARHVRAFPSFFSGSRVVRAPRAARVRLVGREFGWTT